MSERTEPSLSYVEPMDHMNAALLLIGDDPAVLTEMEDAANASGARLLGVLPFAKVAERLAQHSRIDALMIDTAGVDEGLAHETLARVDTLVRDRQVSIIASFPFEHVDMVSARMLSPHATLLCAPSTAERCAALALMARTSSDSRMNDIARDAERRRLRQLNEEVARIAETLARLTRHEPEPSEGRDMTGRSDAFIAPPSVEAGTSIDSSEIRASIRARRLRDEFFDRELFADPAWDMLLDLFTAYLDHVRVSVSSLCIAAAVPPTTALRWIGTMRDAGLFERQDDPFDRRRAFIGLTAKALAGMQGYVAATKKAGLAIA